MGRGQFMIGRQGPGDDVCDPVSRKPLDRSFSHLLPNSCQGSIGSTLEACPELGRVVLSSAITPARPPSALSLHSSDASSRAFLLPASCSVFRSDLSHLTCHRTMVKGPAPRVQPLSTSLTQGGDQNWEIRWQPVARGCNPTFCT